MAGPESGTGREKQKNRTKGRTVDKTFKQRVRFRFRGGDLIASNMNQEMQQPASGAQCALCLREQQSVFF